MGSWDVRHACHLAHNAESCAGLANWIGSTQINNIGQKKKPKLTILVNGYFFHRKLIE